jgi:hypothetical protein
MPTRLGRPDTTRNDRYHIQYRGGTISASKPAEGPAGGAAAAPLMITLPDIILWPDSRCGAVQRQQ